MDGSEYNVFGHRGRLVGDSIHAYDVAQFMSQFITAPRSAEVYSLGVGKNSTCSILEALASVERHSGRRQVYTYVDEPRIVDHICYYSDLRKMTTHYPQGAVTKSLDGIFDDICRSWSQRRVA
jgi:CDP-paratose 2-epimerase